jgi:hypothetical protein
MKNLFKALAQFQQEVPAIHEGTKGYGYTYSDLKTIFKVINPILKKHNLGFTQLFEGNSIKTIIFHTESGESLESVLDMPTDVSLKGMNTFQVAGSGITYYRRYSLSSVLGLVTDVDSDATGEETQKPKKQPKQTPTKKQEVKDWLGLCNAIEDPKQENITKEWALKTYELSEARIKQIEQL